jgi:hypothetical protein
VVAVDVEEVDPAAAENPPDAAQRRRVVRVRPDQPDPLPPVRERPVEQPEAHVVALRDVDADEQRVVGRRSREEVEAAAEPGADLEHDLRLLGAHDLEQLEDLGALLGGTDRDPGEVEALGELERLLERGHGGGLATELSGGGACPRHLGHEPPELRNPARRLSHAGILRAPLRCPHRGALRG